MEPILLEKGNNFDERLAFFVERDVFLERRFVLMSY